MNATEIQKADMDPLVVRYNALPNEEQTLLQLCSVIYEPTNIDTLWSCYHQIELSIQDNKIKNKKELKRVLQLLQKRNFLNSDFTCNPAILEEVSRHAVSSKTPWMLKQHIAYLDAAAAWVKPPSNEYCGTCGMVVPFLAAKTPTGWICASCALLKLKAFAEKENITSWSMNTLKESLLPDSRVGRRLIVLFGFSDAIQLIINKAPQEARELMRFVVRNLGYLGPHPFALIVRQAALNSCKATGMLILPFLLEMFDTEPWEYYANIILAAAAIAPNDRQVQRMLKNAAKSPDERINTCAGSIMAAHPSEWAEMHSLSHDSHPSSPWEPVISDLFGKPGIIFSTDKYSLIAKTVQDSLPITENIQNKSTASTRKRLMRDFRIGLYTYNEALLESRYQHLCTFYNSPDSGNEFNDDPFVTVCRAPFNKSWFDTLPVRIRLYTLTEIFLNTLSTTESDEPALNYALDKRFQETIPNQYQNDFYKFLISRLLVGGRLNDARKLITNMNACHNTDGLYGWLYFLEGKNNLSLKAFETDLNQLQKSTYSYIRFFSGISGLFYILALLKHQCIHDDPFSLDKAEEFVTMALTRQYRISFMFPAYLSLKAIIEAQQNRINDAEETLSKIVPDNNCFAALFICLAEYWVRQRVDSKKVALFVETYLQSKNIGLNWFAMESAELLCRIEQSTPVRKKFVKQINAKTGMTPFSEYAPSDETWQKNLRALAKITAAAAPQQNDGTSRLIWLLDYRHNRIVLEPREQKRTNKDTWTRGRPVSLARLYHGSNLNFLTAQDRKVCAAIEKISLSDGGLDYKFNTGKLLPSLAEHPLLFSMKNPDMPVQVKIKTPQVLLKKTTSGLNLKLSPAIPAQSVSVIKEGSSLFNIFLLSEKQQRVAAILDKKGLDVPFFARKDMLSVISGISSILTVHSSLDDQLPETEFVQADATPYIHLTPVANGFHLQLLVKPFTSSKPFLEPGKGEKNIIAEINGQRYQTKRNLDLEKQNASFVIHHCPNLDPASRINGKWFIATPEDCLDILTTLKALQDQKTVIIEWPEGEKIKLVRTISPENLYLQIKGKGDWFELSGHITINPDLALDMQHLLAHTRENNGRYIPLKDGQFIALTRSLKERLAEISPLARYRGKDIQLPFAAPLLIDDTLTSIPNCDLDTTWTDQADKIKYIDHFNPALPKTLAAALRSYQLEGFKWLSRLAFLGYGACLADDMGLGKTLQALTIVLDRSENGPSLVVAPTSVCMNWHNEIKNFAPTLCPVQFVGKERKSLIKQLKPYDVLIISYALMQMEAELLSDVSWETIVLDEAQAIKNQATKRSKAALALNGKFKMITTGTPIENHLGELYTLFKFINPGLLGPQKQFNARFIQPIEKDKDAHALNQLKQLIRPFILRRIKSSVLHELPPRTDIVLNVEMSEKESAFYETLRLEAIDNLNNNHQLPEGQKHLKILAEITRLRRACCNPRLILKNRKIPSAKLELFSTIIPEILENKHKALVFSQFVDHLSIIREFLDRHGFNYCYLDGNTPGKERQKQVDAFQTGNYDLFLISLKAGGVGLNLTAADFVIHMDPWWNPAVEDQASDRAHRIGQKNPVTVYRLVMKNTIEEKIVNLHHEKRDLAGSLLSGSDLSGKMSSDELVTLIREV